MEQNIFNLASEHVRKYLILYTLISVAIAVSIGYYSQDFTAAHKGLFSNLVIFFSILTIYPSMVQLKTEGLAKMFKMWKPIFVSLIYVFVLSPIIAFTLAPSFGNNQIGIGFVASNVVPASTASLGYVLIAGGSIELATALGVLSLVIAIPAIPFFLSLYGNQVSVTTPIIPLMTSLLYIMILPLIAGQLTRYLIRKKKGVSFVNTTIKPYLSLATMLSMFALIFVLVDKEAAVMITKPELVGYIIGYESMIIIGILVFSMIVSRLMHFTYEDHQAVALISAPKNQSVAAAIATMALNPASALTPAIIPMIQPVITIIYIHFEKPLRRFLVPGAAKQAQIEKDKKMKLKPSWFAALYIIQIVIMTFSVRSSNNVLQTTLPLLSKYNFFYNEFEVGILIALMSLSALIAMIFNGRLHSYLRRYSFILANIIYTITFLLFSFSGSISVVIYAVVSGFSYGLIFPNIMTAAGISEDRKARERMLAIYSLTLSISLIGGPALESLILRYYPLNYVFILFLPIVILSTVISPFLKFPEEDRSKKRPTVWDKPGFRMAIYTLIVYTFPTAFIISFGGIFAVDQFHASYSLVAILFALFFISSFLTRIFFSFLDIKKLWPYILALMVISLLGLSMVFISINIIVYSIGLIILGVPHGLGMPIATYSIGRSFPASERNTANSYFTSTMMSTNIIILLFGGMALEFIGLRLLMLFMIPIVVLLLYLTVRVIRSDSTSKIE